MRLRCLPARRTLRSARPDHVPASAPAHSSVPRATDGSYLPLRPLRERAKLAMVLEGERVSIRRRPQGGLGRVVAAGEMRSGGLVRGLTLAGGLPAAAMDSDRAARD